MLIPQHSTKLFPFESSHILPKHVPSFHVESPLAIRNNFHFGDFALDDCLDDYPDGSIYFGDLSDVDCSLSNDASLDCDFDGSRYDNDYVYSCYCDVSLHQAFQNTQMTRFDVLCVLGPIWVTIIVLILAIEAYSYNYTSIVFSIHFHPINLIALIFIENRLGLLLNIWP